jgi:ComF family protein
MITYLQRINDNMSLLDTILSKITPYSCLSCRSEGALLCDACTLKIPPALDRCYRCYAPTVAGMTCADCQPASALSVVRTVTLYDGVAKDLLWKLKSGGAQEASRQMAALMAPLVGSVLVITHVPTATSRVRQRGYDQARLLARNLARETRSPRATLLVRTGQAHQVGASRAVRLQQLTDAFRPRSGWQIRGAHILLVDDVLTTGATFEAAARVLLAAGAARVDAIAFARA